MDALKDLEYRLAQLCRQAGAAAATPGAGNERAAYARGLADALSLVRSLTPDTGTASPSASQERNAAPKPHQMPPADVMGLDMAAVETDDLVEAAFTFETMLLDLLEDDNTLPYEVYTGLSRDQLSGIITKSAQKICQLREE